MNIKDFYPLTSVLVSNVLHDGYVWDSPMTLRDFFNYYSE